LPPTHINRRRFALAVLAAAVLVLSAPFLGLFRYRLQHAYPRQFVWIVGAVVGAGVLAAIISALTRIRERRAIRYGTIGLAIGIAAGYAWLNAGENQDSNAVELLHFLQYGVVTFLFYRACMEAGDPSIAILPLLAGVIVGTAEEWLQWFLPVRVGELRDLYLNLAAILCGLLFSVAIDPPRVFRRSLVPGSYPLVRRFAVAAILALAAFVHVVHLGHDIRDEEAGVFESRYSRARLAALQVEKAEQWRTDPLPLAVRRVSREDQYMTEGVQHVRWRNRKWDEGDVLAAWNENRILEKYFAPVLDTPSYISATGHRWPDAQRADAERRAGPQRSAQAAAYVSHAFPYPVFAWPTHVYWAIVGALLASVVLGLSELERRQRDVAVAAAGDPAR
jgi:VanZ family protein